VTTTRLRALVLAFSVLATGDAQGAANVIQDEARVPPYTLPPVLQLEGGGGWVTDAAQWFERRRPELLEVFSREVYGRPLPPPRTPHWRVLAEDRSALGGRATRREVALDLDDSDRSRVLRFVVYLPNAAAKPVPVFVGVHLFDTAKPYPEPAVARRLKGGQPASSSTNGPAARPGQPGRDTADLILARGYALASVDIEFLAPDSKTNWWQGLHRVLGRTLAGPPGPDECATLGLWAWGLSRTIDYFGTTTDIDPHRTIAIGHSRMGKAALWAGATDRRFAAVISNNSGCGGAALSKRIFGETVGIITRAFPHWFTGNFNRYADHEADLPVDQHELLALIAPRPLYVASAGDDAWADPRGEFLAAWHAAPVYRLLGIAAFDSAIPDLPPVDVPVGDVLRYHIRRGQHDLTDYDWRQYLDFAGHQVR
jgi:hypothetical protein